MYLVQKTASAHVVPPSSAFTTVSRHRTEERARAAHERLRRSRARRCGPGAWDCNLRILDGKGRELDL